MNARVLVRGQEVGSVPEGCLEVIRRIGEGLDLGTCWDDAGRTLHIDSPVQGRTIVIDRGDGGLDVATILESLFRSAGARVVPTSSSSSLDSPAELRKAIRHARPDLFLGVGRSGVSRVGIHVGLYPYGANRRLAVALKEELNLLDLWTGIDVRLSSLLWAARSPGALVYLPPIPGNSHTRRLAESLYNGIARFFSRRSAIAVKTRQPQLLLPEKIFVREEEARVDETLQQRAMLLAPKPESLTTWEPPPELWLPISEVPPEEGGTINAIPVNIPPARQERQQRQERKEGRERRERSIIPRHPVVRNYFIVERGVPVRISPRANGN